MKIIKAPAKIKVINVCNDCGKRLDLTDDLRDLQIKYMDNEFVRVSCDECIAKNHTLTNAELGMVQKEIPN